MDSKPPPAPPTDAEEAQLDAALEGTFPASDPVALSIPHSHDDPVAED